MNRRNFALSAVALAAMALVPFTACKKDGGGGAGSSSDMLSYMPQDSSAIVGFSVEKATSSSLFKKYQDTLMADNGKGLADVKEKCGIDVIADVNSAVIAFGKDFQDEKSAILGVKGNFNEKKVTDCITKMGGKVEGSVISSPEGQTLNFFWASSDTVMISKGVSADAIKASKKGASVKQNKDLMELIGKVDSSATVWVAGTVPTQFGGMMAGATGGTAPKSGFVSLNINDGIGADIGLIFASAEEAKSVSTKLTAAKGMAVMLPPAAKPIIDGISIEASGSTVTIKSKITSDQLTSLEKIAPPGTF